MIPKCSRDVQVFTLMSLPRDYSNLPKSGIGDLRNFIRLTDKYGFHGILVAESVNGYFHPWVVAQEILSHSDSLSPLVAVNPMFAHPFTIAKQVATLTRFYDRRLCLNFITGTAKDDFDRLGDMVSHNDRYKRLEEFIRIVYDLLMNDKPFSFNGSFYNVNNLRLPLNLPSPLLPDIYIAGSSAEAIDLLKKRNGINLRMARPMAKIPEIVSSDLAQGFHFGIIARQTSSEAYQRLNEISPASRERQLLQKFSMRNTDAVWKKDLLNMADEINGEDTIFSIAQFQNFYSDVPYLVGDYHSVASYIRQYVSAGIRFFIVEVPLDTKNEMQHIAEVFSLLDSKKHE
jgi:alkanesulfonate monooxygenase